MEKTLVMIKPDCFELSDQIIEELGQHGLCVARALVERVPKEVIEEHYAVHREKPFFGYMTEYLIGKPVTLAIYNGVGVINKIIDAVGPTDPAKAPRDTLRGKYCNDSLERAIAEGRPVRNGIHRSDSVAEAVREIDVWKRYILKK